MLAADKKQGGRTHSVFARLLYGYFLLLISVPAGGAIPLWCGSSACASTTTFRGVP